MDKVYCKDCAFHRHESVCSRCKFENYYGGDNCGPERCQEFDICTKHAEEYTSRDDSVCKEGGSRFSLCEDTNKNNDCKDFEQYVCRGFFERLFNK